MLSPLKELLSDFKLVLASSSPQRKAIFDQLGLQFSVVPSTFDEESIDKTGYTEAGNYVKCLAHQKALNVAQTLVNTKEKHLVVGADTVVVHNGKIIGKPHVKETATKTLQLLSNKTHLVCTGVSIVEVEPDSDFAVTMFCETTKVTFSLLSAAMIKSYVDSKEPLNKAGAYGIQGLGALLVENIEGDYNNVVGFPAYRFFTELTKFLSRVPES
uniref:Maf-like protein DDB_G0267852 n=1 Tax=Phallusia mammillata TaxID=59560 RepID=A0A6F9D7Q7_9ASCI|nr:maf-like protein DDB_G0267852 [Phallusia mammillata]